MSDLISPNNPQRYNLGGVWAPCLTPINEDYSIDCSKLHDHIEWLLSNGCTGVALFGTTGEAASFSAAERTEALEKIVKSGIAPDRLMIGNGFTSISDTVKVTNHALELGCEKVLMIPPFFFKDLSTEGIAVSYRYVLDQVNSSNLKVILYNFPQMSTVPITHELIDRLIESHDELIVGLKDSSGDWNSVEGFIQNFPKLSVFPGSDLHLLQGLKVGGVGTITATADINPQGIRRVYDLWAEDEDAEEAQSRADMIREIVFQYPLAAALKAIHSVFRSDPQWRMVRPPLTVLGTADTEKLLGELDSAGFRLAS